MRVGPRQDIAYPYPKFPLPNPLVDRIFHRMRVWHVQQLRDKVASVGKEVRKVLEA